MKPLSGMGKYATVVVDPPWPHDFGAQRQSHIGYRYTQKPYESMSVDDIAMLDIPEVLADDALVFLWTVNKFLPISFDLVAQWGCAYSMTMTWVKPHGMKFPHLPMFNTEWCIIGRKGKISFRDTKGFATANYWPRGGHSEKPEGFYDLLRRVTPGPRLDVFGRRRIAGFDSWGNEAPEGLALPDHYQTVMM